MKSSKITGFFKSAGSKQCQNELVEEKGDDHSHKHQEDSTDTPGPSKKLKSSHSNPVQPLLKNYPKDKYGRSFQASWYKRFSWLEYSTDDNKAYCFPCKEFSTHISKSEVVFSETGYSNWSIALTSGKGFNKHESSKDHLLAMERWQNKLNIDSGKNISVINQIDPDRMSVVLENREYIKLLLQYHIYFVKNELAYRGHDETEDSISPGKWKDFIDLQLKTNPEFHRLHTHVVEQKKSCDYTSKRSCNEMIQVLSEAVAVKIVDDINETKMFSIMIDESKDNAGHEELALCVQYVKDYTTQERFLTLRRVDKADAHTIVEKHILPHLKEMGFLAELLGGGADGASVMSGAYEGVFEILKGEFPWLLYIHCAAHRNNLVVTSYLSTLKEAVDVIKIYKALHTVFNVANNREIYEKHQANLYPKEHKKCLSALTEIRWGCQFEGVDTILTRIRALLASLSDIAGSTSDTADKAAGIYHKMLSSNFITSLVSIILNKCIQHLINIRCSPNLSQIQDNWGMMNNIQK